MCLLYSLKCYCLWSQSGSSVDKGHDCWSKRVSAQFQIYVQFKLIFFCNRPLIICVLLSFLYLIQVFQGFVLLHFQAGWIPHYPLATLPSVYKFLPMLSKCSCNNMDYPHLAGHSNRIFVIHISSPPPFYWTLFHFSTVLSLIFNLSSFPISLSLCEFPPPRILMAEFTPPVTELFLFSRTKISILNYCPVLN